MRQYFVLVASCLLLAGCYTPSSEMNQVQIGMSEKDVIKIMGTPVSKGESKDGDVTLYYSLQEIFGSPPQPYSVHLNKGQVDWYGRTEVDSDKGGHSAVVTPIITH